MSDTSKQVPLYEVIDYLEKTGQSSKDIADMRSHFGCEVDPLLESRNLKTKRTETNEMHDTSKTPKQMVRLDKVIHYLRDSGQNEHDVEILKKYCGVEESPTQPLCPLCGNELRLHESYSDSGYCADCGTPGCFFVTRWVSDKKIVLSQINIIHAVIDKQKSDAVTAAVSDMKAQMAEQAKEAKATDQAFEMSVIANEHHKAQYEDLLRKQVKADAPAKQSEEADMAALDKSQESTRALVETIEGLHARIASLNNELVDRISESTEAKKEAQWYRAWLEEVKIYDGPGVQFAEKCRARVNELLGQEHAIAALEGQIREQEVRVLRADNTIADLEAKIAEQAKADREALAAALDKCEELRAQQQTEPQVPENPPPVNHLTSRLPLNFCIPHPFRAPLQIIDVDKLAVEFLGQRKQIEELKNKVKDLNYQPMTPVNMQQVLKSKDNRIEELENNIQEYIDTGVMLQTQAKRVSDNYRNKRIKELEKQLSAVETVITWHRLAEPPIGRPEVKIVLCSRKTGIGITVNIEGLPTMGFPDSDPKENWRWAYQEKLFRHAGI